MDWGGGLIWYQGPGSAEQIRSLTPSCHADPPRRTVRPGLSAAIRLDGAVVTILRRSFDPHGILNPGLMDA